MAELTHATPPMDPTVSPTPAEAPTADALTSPLEPVAGAGSPLALPAKGKVVILRLNKKPADTANQPQASGTPTPAATNQAPPVPAPPPASPTIPPADSPIASELAAAPSETAAAPSVTSAAASPAAALVSPAIVAAVSPSTLHIDTATPRVTKVYSLARQPTNPAPPPAAVASPIPEASPMVDSGSKPTHLHVVTGVTPMAAASAFAAAPSVQSEPAVAAVEVAASPAPSVSESAPAKKVYTMRLATNTQPVAVVLADTAVVPAVDSTPAPAAAAMTATPAAAAAPTPLAVPEQPRTPTTPIHPSALAAAAAGPILSPSELAGLLAGSRPATSNVDVPQPLPRMISSSSSRPTTSASRPVTGMGGGGGGGVSRPVTSGYGSATRPLTSGMGAASRPMTSADNAPDHPAAAAIAELTPEQLQELISKPTTPRGVTADAARRPMMQINSPTQTMIHAPTRLMTPQRADEVQHFERSPSPQQRQTAAAAAAASVAAGIIPAVAFNSPARGSPAASATAASVPSGEADAIKPFVQPSPDGHPPPSSSRRRSGVLEHLPAMATTTGSTSRRSSRVISETPTTLLPGSILSPEPAAAAAAASASAVSPATSKSRRNSLSQVAGHFLPPISKSPGLENTSAPPNNMTPSSANTPGHPIFSPSGARRGSSNGGGLHLVSPSLHSSPASASRGTRTPDAASGFGGVVGGLTSPSMPRTPPTAGGRSPGPSARNPAAPITGMGTSSRRMVSPIAIGAPGTPAASQQVVPTSLLAPPAHSALSSKTRWRWLVAMLPGVLTLIFTLIYIFVHLDGYSVLRPLDDTLIGVGFLLHAVGIVLLLGVCVLILALGTPFRSAVGVCYQIGLTCSMLGTAAWVQSTTNSAMTSIFSSTMVGMFQLQILGCVLLFIVFAAWLHTAPMRSVQRVLVVLESLDMSALSRDIRAMKGLNAELIQAAQVQAHFPNALAPSPPAADYATVWENRSSHGYSQPYDTRPFTGQTLGQPGGELRPTTGGGGIAGSREVDIVTYSYQMPAGALATAISPSGPTATGGFDQQQHHHHHQHEARKKKRSSVGNSTQFLSVSGMALIGAQPVEHQQFHSRTPSYANSENMALPLTARAPSVEMTAMKALMAANLDLQQKLAAIESENAERHLAAMEEAGGWTTAVDQQSRRLGNGLAEGTDLSK